MEHLRSRIAKGIPSVGYQIYRLCGEIKLQELNQVQGAKRIQKEELAWEGSFENSWYKAQFNERMELTSLVEFGKA
jgi:GMP synthase PP-ATPase subunit